MENINFKGSNFLWYKTVMDPVSRYKTRLTKSSHNHPPTPKCASFHRPKLKPRCPRVQDAMQDNWHLQSIPWLRKLVQICFVPAHSLPSVLWICECDCLHKLWRWVQLSYSMTRRRLFFCDNHQGCKHKPMSFAKSSPRSSQSCHLNRIRTYSP